VEAGQKRAYREYYEKQYGNGEGKLTAEAQRGAEKEVKESSARRPSCSVFASEPSSLSAPSAPLR